MWFVLSAALACAAATPVAALDGAEAAYAGLFDEVIFHLDRLGLLLPCVTEPVAPTVAVRVPRVQGLRLWASLRRPPPVAPLAAVSGTRIAGAATSYGLAWSAPLAAPPSGL